MAGYTETETSVFIPDKTINPGGPIKRPPKKPPPPPTAPSGYLTFRGKGKFPHNPDSFTVMCGEQPPNIKAGYATWSTIPRPLRRGVTVFSGYEPASMEIQVRFGVWDSDGWKVGRNQPGDEAHQVERDIGVLEWMAGSNFVSGPSPYVYANSFDPTGNTTPLIPFQYQQTVGVRGPLHDARSWPWVISGGIQWGESVRNRWGYRVRQDATFTLINYQGFTPPPTPSVRGGYFVANRQRWNARLIAEAPSAHALHPQSLAREIISSPKNKHLHLKTTGQRIKPGKRVWVPAHQS